MNAHSKIETGRMTSKGQVLIPKAVRDAIGLAPNAAYTISVNEENKAVISPIGYGPQDAQERVRRMREGIAKLRGTSTLGMSTDQYMMMIRGDRQP